MIIHSSAIIADEPERARLEDSLAAALVCRIGAPTLVETTMVLTGRFGDTGRLLLGQLLQHQDADTVPFGSSHWLAAQHAFVRYGKGRHPAALSFGDCLTYAIASLSGDPFLCVGDDFTQTDLDWSISVRENSMLDHIGIGAVDMDAAKAFYSTVLAPLGAGVLMDFGEAVGFGPEGGPPSFWIGTATASTAWEAHIAFSAADRAAVDAFHAAAVGAGAEELHAPGLHPEYHEHYYGAFVRDPDGNNVEAVCHKPE